jgi:hypothetical protein
MQIAADVSSWHIASLRCDKEFGRYSAIADIGQVSINHPSWLLRPNDTKFGLLIVCPVSLDLPTY